MTKDSVKPGDRKERGCLDKNQQDESQLSRREDNLQRRGFSGRFGHSCQLPILLSTRSAINEYDSPSVADAGV
jgi:hypothetical protein